MNRPALLKIVNFALMISFSAQAATSVIIFFGISVPEPKMIVEFHEYNGLVFIILAAAHIILNRGWIKASFFGGRKPR